MATNTNIPFPQSQFLDPQTGRPAREWVIWLQNPRLVSLTTNYQQSTGGNIDNTPIGQTIPAAGAFTTLTAISFQTNALNNTPIGNTGPSTGRFTTVTATGGISGGVF
jgi:hypothetical protein